MPKRNRHSNKRDDALDKTFPASDSVAQGGATATEPPTAPMDRKPPLISREQIEAAERDEGHRHLHRPDANEASVGKTCKARKGELDRALDSHG